MPAWFDALKQRARRLKRELFALGYAYRDHRTPWYARAMCFCVVAYALSPIDLIPDFVPVLGYLDDLILLPLGIALALRWIPPAVMDDARARAETTLAENRSPGGATVGWLAAVLIAAIWLVLLFVIGRALWNLWAARRP
jgi:uncharacterized membrane protein YkvA (DUF1232 family)